MVQRFDRASGAVTLYDPLWATDGEDQARTVTLGEFEARLNDGVDGPAVDLDDPARVDWSQRSALFMHGEAYSAPYRGPLDTSVEP